MTSDKTAIFGGLIILVGGLALAMYANTNAAALSQAKAKTVTKYISLSEKALTKGNQREAEKFVIKALETNPKSKLAIAAFKKVEVFGYTAKTATNPTPAAATKKPAENQPAKPAPEEEAEEEMGCI